VQNLAVLAKTPWL